MGSQCGLGGIPSSIFKEIPNKLCVLIEAHPVTSSRTKVVKETLRHSLVVVDRCGQDQALVTFDLAIAKKTNGIQYKESPLLNNIFESFGSLHIEITFFHH